jgi:hypothetical protein
VSVVRPDFDADAYVGQLWNVPLDPSKRPRRGSGLFAGRTGAGVPAGRRGRQSIHAARQSLAFLVFPGANHEFSRSGTPHHRKQRSGRIRAWWARHLPTTANPAPGAIHDKQ